MSAKDIAQSITDAGLTIEKNQVILNKSLKSLSYEDISIKLHPEVSINIKLNIARSNEESKEQNKLGRPIISTETGGGDIRSERAQKDAKRFDKKEDKVIDKNVTTTPEIEINENEDNNKAKDVLENKDISEVIN